MRVVPQTLPDRSSCSGRRAEPSPGLSDPSGRWLGLLLSRARARPGHSKAHLRHSIPGLEGESEPLSQVSAMAAHYLRMIRQVQPVGPYSLGGWSLGGLIGLEIAQQLTARASLLGSPN